MWDQILCKITVATIALIYGLSVVSSYWYLTKYPSWITELRQLKIKGGGQADLGAGVTRGEALYYIFAPWFPVINT